MSTMGRITAPILLSSCMLRRWMVEKGHSRTASTSLRRSFRVTSAARSSRLSLYPVAMPATVFILQGTTIIPAVRKLPLAGAAPISPLS